MTQKVLVSGASGYIAGASVRSKVKADQILAKYPQYKDKLEFVIVEDIAKDGAFEGKLDGLDGIFHVASPFHFKITTSNKVDLLDPAIKGTSSILESAAKVPSIRRIIITSSFAAIVDPAKPRGYVYSENDWNPVTYEQAATLDPVTAYRGSKKLAEKAAHDFINERKPHFVVTINPPFVFGPFEHHVEKIEDLNESANLFYQYITGKKELSHPVVDIYADVRDVASAHILAFESSPPNSRFFIVNDRFSWQDVADVAHKYFPGQTNMKVGNPGEQFPHNMGYDNSKSINILGIKYRSKEETFKDTIDQLLQFQQTGK